MQKKKKKKNPAVKLSKFLKHCFPDTFLQDMSHLAEYIFNCEIYTLLATFQLFESFLPYTLRLFYTLYSLEILLNHLVAIIWYKIDFNKYYTL